MKESSGKNQGEGDKASAREYNRATREFVESGDAREAIDAEKRKDRPVPDEPTAAEREGLERVAEEDPAVKRDYSDRAD